MAAEMLGVRCCQVTLVLCHGYLGGYTRFCEPYPAASRGALLDRIAILLAAVGTDRRAGVACSLAWALDLGYARALALAVSIGRPQASHEVLATQAARAETLIDHPSWEPRMAQLTAQILDSDQLSVQLHERRPLRDQS